MGNYLIIILCLLLTSNIYVQIISGANINIINNNKNTTNSTKNTSNDDDDSTSKSTTITLLGAVNSTKSTRNRHNNNGSNTQNIHSNNKDTVSTTIAPHIPSSTVRRPTSNRLRDNKLMNVLQARRTGLNRDRWTLNGKSNATTSANDHISSSSATDTAQNIRPRSRTLGIRENKYRNSNNTSITNNSIVEPVEEYLQVDESVHQAYNISPEPLISSSTEATTPSITKEPRNYVNINRTKVRSKSFPSTTTIEFTTIKATRLYYDTRQKHNRGKARFMPQKSPYDSELIQFAIYGQKSVVTPKSQISSVNRKISRKRGSAITNPSNAENENKISDDKLEILDVSVPPRASSTEKVKLWQNRINQVTRNIVAYNTLVRQRHPMYSESIKADPTLTIIRPTTLRSRITPNTASVAALNPVNNFIEGTAEPKEVFLRSANATQLETTTEPEITTIENNETETVPQKLPGLIINIPDDATPEGTAIHDQATSSHTNVHVNPVKFYTTTPSTSTSVKMAPEIVTTINVIEEVDGQRATVNVLNVTRGGARSLNEATVQTTKSPSSIYTRRTTTTRPTIPPTIVVTRVSSEVIPTTTKEITQKATVVSDHSTPRSTSVTITATTSTTSTTTTTTTSTTTTTTEIPVTSSSIPPKITNYLSPELSSEQSPPKTLNRLNPKSQPTNNDVTIEMDKMNLATYILIGLAMVPVAAIILYAIRVVIANHDNKNNLDMLDGQPISPVVKLECDTASNSTDESVLGHESMMFNRNNLRFKSLLGEGNFGQVWKAEVDDVRGHLQGTTRVVAVKTERRDNGQGGLKVEAEIMRKLGSAHQNVVKLLGACTEQEPHLIIMEYAMRGRLLSLLRAARGGRNSLPQTLPTRPAVMPLSPRRLTGFALDIAKGMEYIASKKIVHRDLAARNVLLDHNGLCKICDFGMSIDLGKAEESHSIPKIPRVHHESKFKFDLASRAFNGAARHWDAFRNHHNDSNKHDNKTNRPALPIRWMAPEALQYHIYSTKTDVFAFGIVLWEIATLGCTPYPNLSGREVIRNVPNGTRPEIPPDCRQELYDLMNRTWRKDPHQRPSFTEARQILNRTVCQWQCDDNSDTSEYMDVSGFSEDLEHGMVYFNRRVSEFECEI